MQENNIRANKMKTSHIFWGTLFITVGLLVLINNFTSIFMDWSIIWKLWPLAVILLGVSLLVKHKAGKGLIAAVAALVLGLAIFATTKSASDIVNNDFEIVVDDSDVHFDTTEYNEDFDSHINYAILHFDGGAGSFNIKDTTSKLVYIKTEGRKNNYAFSRYDSDSTTNVKLKMKKTRWHIGGGNYKNRVDISLNPMPVWNLDFDAGAADINLDLTEYKISNVSVDMGAASLDIRFGNLYKDSHLEIDAGASDMNIYIPKESGCEIRTDVALTSKNFDEFNKINSGLYRTSNFEDTENKIFIEVESGVSSISVKRY